MVYSTGNSTLTGWPGKNGKAESEVSPSVPWPVGVRVDLPVQEAKCCQQALASNALQFERNFFFFVFQLNLVNVTERLGTLFKNTCKPMAILLSVVTAAMEYMSK